MQLAQINRIRREENRPNFFFNKILARFARWKAKQLNTNKKLKHGDTHSQLKKKNISGIGLVELIAEGNNPLKSFLSSKGHRGALLDSRKKLIGFGSNGKYHVILLAKEVN